MDNQTYMDKNDMIYFLNQLVARIKEQDSGKYMSRDNMKYFLTKLVDKVKEASNE